MRSLVGSPWKYCTDYRVTWLSIVKMEMGCDMVLVEQISSSSVWDMNEASPKAVVLLSWSPDESTVTVGVPKH